MDGWSFDMGLVCRSIRPLWRTKTVGVAKTVRYVPTMKRIPTMAPEEPTNMWAGGIGKSANIPLGILSKERCADVRLWGADVGLPDLISLYSGSQGIGN